MIYLGWYDIDRGKKWLFLLITSYMHTILCSGVFLGGVFQQWWTRWCAAAAAQRWLHCQCTWAQLPVREETINAFFKWCCIFTTSVLVRSESTYWPGLQCQFYKTGFCIYEVWKLHGFRLNMGWVLLIDLAGFIVFWALTVALLKMQVLWDITQCQGSVAFI